jgi:hypothetical protein
MDRPLVAGRRNNREVRSAVYRTSWIDFHRKQDPTWGLPPARPRMGGRAR